MISKIAFHKIDLSLSHYFTNTLKIMAYSCPSCDKKFHFKRFFDNHRIACDFFNQTRKIQHSDNDEQIPSKEDMFKLLQHLSLRCHLLTEDVEKLKRCAVSSNKKTVESILDSIKPIMTFDEWTKTISVCNDCITEIFNKNLTDGIIKCITDRIEYEDTDFILPLRSFKGALYAYLEDEETYLRKWILCPIKKFNSMIEIIKHEIVKFYCDWKEVQNPMHRDIEMAYLTKITGLKINKNKQSIDIRTWLTTHINSE
jgi:hypothetical protein